ncbi:MAG: hypothetical protein QNJ44_17695 [Rhodobacter sp.]|nr:hypothetical protein [Rhodobacter sp.]
MHTNIIPFPANRPVPPVRFDDATYDNVVSLDDRREKARVRRTCGGVFFVSPVLCADGDVA